MCFSIPAIHGLATYTEFCFRRSKSSSLDNLDSSLVLVKSQYHYLAGEFNAAVWLGCVLSLCFVGIIIGFYNSESMSRVTRYSLIVAAVLMAAIFCFYHVHYMLIRIYRMDVAAAIYCGLFVVLIVLPAVYQRCI